MHKSILGWANIGGQDVFKPISQGFRNDFVQYIAKADGAVVSSHSERRVRVPWGLKQCGYVDFLQKKA